MTCSQGNAGNAGKHTSIPYTCKTCKWAASTRLASYRGLGRCDTGKSNMRRDRAAVTCITMSNVIVLRVDANLSSKACVMCV